MLVSVVGFEHPMRWTLDVLFEDLFTGAFEQQQQQGASIGDSGISGAAARRVDQAGWLSCSSCCLLQLPVLPAVQ